MFEEWNCEVCGERRPDEKISVVTHDYSEQHDLPYGTVKRNVKHCNDNFSCKLSAENKERWSLKK